MRADTRITSISGCTLRALAISRSTSKSRCGRRSHLATSIKFAAARCSIFQRLVFALGDRSQHHLVRLAEVEAGRTHQIADILDEQHPVTQFMQPVKGARHHRCIQMAALAGVHLHRRGLVRRGYIGIVAGLLIALDDRQRQRARKA